MRDNNPTVYSTEWGRVCPKCGKPTAQCTCKKQPPARPKSDGIVRVMRESKGRKGKVVSLITGLTLNEDDLHTLLTELKHRCGAGGAFKDGVLEIQGDHRDTIFEELKSRGYTVKKVG
jgi:translation initiation factor 1